MINLDYNNFLKDKDFDFVKQYLSDLKTITKFEEPNENIEERFENRRWKKTYQSRL